MAHKKKHSPAPVPPANRPHSGPESAGEGVARGQQDLHGAGGGESFQEQDPQRRLGDYTGAGEQSFKQPGGKNDANH